MLFLKRKLPSVLGIDISATAVKLIELASSGGALKVVAHAAETLPAGAITDRSISNIEAVGEAIARTIKTSKSKTKHAAVAVSGTSVITKTINMPSGLSDDDMETQIQLEADQYIPFPLEEVALDFQVLGQSSDNEEQVDVLLAASRSEDVDNRVAALEVANIKAKVVDLESFAIENTVSMIANNRFDDAKEKVIAVADVGSAVTAFSVFSGLKTTYSREQNFGGEQLTEAIQNAYGLSHEEAVLAKKQGGKALPDNYVQDVLNPFKDSIAQHISRAQQFFYSSSNISYIDHLFLAGGCASIPGIAEMVEANIGVPTVIANPFQHMSCGSKVSASALDKDAPAMMIACGLALRSFG